MISEVEKVPSYWVNLIPRLGWDKRRMEKELKQIDKYLQLNMARCSEVIIAKKTAIEQLLSKE